MVQSPSSSTFKKTSLDSSNQYSLPTSYSSATQPSQQNVESFLPKNGQQSTTSSTSPSESQLTTSSPSAQQTNESVPTSLQANQYNNFETHSNQQSAFAPTAESYISNEKLTDQRTLNSNQNQVYPTSWVFTKH